ncbi:sigma-54-dependent transcriptional regulator [Schlesneria sp. DSM 10557]|uniref:sigma-54-dependent transcriptional regulator n=1 Tax=Schlesneria sp. DSM 10557 TaxID=3044399 RepID=UPI00359FA49A
MSSILIIDDEPAICWSLKERLADQGHRVQTASTIEAAKEILATFAPDVIVLDVRLPGEDGLTAIPRFQQSHPTVPIVVMTAFGDLQTVVEAMNRGAFEYLVKPFELSDFLAVIERALQTASQPTPTASVSSDVQQLVGRGPAMQAVFKQIALVAPTDFPILITGETGTGKELVADAIHRHSRRGSGPFMRVSLASLSPTVIESELFGHVKGAFTGATHDRPGLFELADQGTIFLDEIGETPLSIQVKLLRVLESRCYAPVGSSEEKATNARLIAATNRDLHAMIAEGTFREDLFHRLKVFSIHLPPLRTHREDVRPLVEYFLARQQVPISPTISESFWAEIERREWNGNIRELRNAVDHAAVMARGGPLAAEHLPAIAGFNRNEPQPGLQLEAAITHWVQQQLAEVGTELPSDLHRKFTSIAEKTLFNEVLSYTQQNRSLAAKLLGLDRATLRTKLGPPPT